MAKLRVSELIKFMFKKADTAGKRIALYAWLFGFPLVIVAWFVPYPFSAIVSLSALVLMVPNAVVIWHGLQQSKEKLRRLETEIIVHETILKIFKPEEYERLMAAREVGGLFKSKEGKK